MNRIKTVFTILVLLNSYGAPAQTQDEQMIKAIFEDVLTRGECYQNLEYLSNQIGGRLSGSPGAAQAVKWTREIMRGYGFDTVYRQEVMVPHWVRGEKELAKIIAPNGSTTPVDVVALGNSEGTGADGIKAEVIEVKTLPELELMGKDKIQGKIVFFNRPMDATLISTFKAYGGAADQRVHGPSEAAKYGAVGVVVRSLTLALDDVPHTGTLVYKDDLPHIPAVAISTQDANLLSDMIKINEGLKFYFATHCQTLEDVLSYNVVGEIRGSGNPKDIILVGGHLDSWDNGDGAHDCGTGCMQSIQVLRTLQRLGYQPQHTLRAVLFMNEENGLRGGKKYAEISNQQREMHVAAIESDRGGFLPLGFSIDANQKVFEQLQNWKPLFAPYHIHQFVQGYSGSDIKPLKSQNGALIGLLPDSQRYFDIHHTSEDTFDKVNKRELELGAAAITALVYLIDKYGLPAPEMISSE